MRRRARRSTAIALGAAVALLVAGGLFLVGRWSVPLDHRPGFAAPAVEPIVVNPRVGPMQTVVAMSAQVQYRSLAQVTMPTSPNEFRQVVTTAPLHVGDSVALGALLGAVNELPVFALRGSVPSFRVLHAGDEGIDVKQLTQSLQELGYLPTARPTVDATVFAATAQFLTDRGYPRPASALSETGIDGRMLAFIGDLPATVIDTDLISGAITDDAGATITIGQGEVELVAAPTTPGVDLPVGSAVSVSCPALTADGTSTAHQAAWISRSVGTPTVTAKSEPPRGGTDDVPTRGWIIESSAELSAALGQTCAATATITHGAAATVSVPAAALYSSGDGTTQLHLQTQGTAFTALTVRGGPPAGGWVPILDPPSTLTANTALIAGTG